MTGGIYRGREASAEDLAALGPLIVGQVVPDALALDRIVRRGQTPPTRAVYFLVDTGAAISSIDHDVIADLSLRPGQTVAVIGATQHVVDVPLYAAGLSLWLDGDAGARAQRHFPVRFVGLPRAAHGRYQGILGRDFLRDFDLNYRGPDGQFDLVLRRSDR